MSDSNNNMADREVNVNNLANVQQYNDQLVGHELDGHASLVARPPDYHQAESEEIVQVVYQSNQNGSLVGVESSLLSGVSVHDPPVYYEETVPGQSAAPAPQQPELPDVGQVSYASHPQQSRAASTLPSVAEESSSGAGAGTTGDEGSSGLGAHCDEDTSRSTSRANVESIETAPERSADQPPQRQQYKQLQQQQQQEQQQDLAAYADGRQYREAAYENYNQPRADSTGVDPDAIYSTVNKRARASAPSDDYGYSEPVGGAQTNHEAGKKQSPYENQSSKNDSSFLCTSFLSQTTSSSQQRTTIDAPGSLVSEGNASTLVAAKQSPANEFHTPDYDCRSEAGGGANGDFNELRVPDNYGEAGEFEEKENGENGEDDIGQILLRQKRGAAESGSFKHNFRKKLGVSVSTNEGDLTVHRQKLLESQVADSIDIDDGDPANLPKFKRTHSVSFNIHRSGRHSVDLRNLPSYLQVKRASIVDVAKGAMSSLMHSFGSGAGSSVASQRRDSNVDDEPIFEEPIAPTLSLGQRVAMVGPTGAEFGTVGWIGQLPDFDDDWMVGVIFDNMIGDCDGAHAGVRYFYSRENYAMFVRLSSLTKTDNYIGRPETGTMLSRMSVSLKPGQMISIQRSSYRLQHCFLNAPHQRVGHDVRAVSNRLHCQCHNCGPCAHLTKQGQRYASVPHYGSHHHPHHKENSLAQAAVELLAHHHHHFHEEEEHGTAKQEDYHFGDNAAHACNFVRYSCCQQAGSAGHDFSADCQMVRPELLDNIIHAPKAPHRRSRPRRVRGQARAQQQLAIQGEGKVVEAIMDQSNFSTLNTTDGTIGSWEEHESHRDDDSDNESATNSSSTRSSSGGDDEHQADHVSIYQEHTSYHQDSVAFQPEGNVFSTLDTQVSILDQRRFINQRDSSAFIYSQQSDLSEDYKHRASGFSSTIRRCFACIIGRKREGKRKKRKMSARNRLIEYRRRQSTFVPSTLAKPQEDFASHGLAMPLPGHSYGESNSDYSSYSKSSCSSRSESPNNARDPTGAIQQSMTIEHGVPMANDQLKSVRTRQDNYTSQLSYDDYTFSDVNSSYKKNGYSYDSALTDQGYFDTYTDNSNDTLKQIVDQSINEMEPVEPVIRGGEWLVSPVVSNDDTTPSGIVDISSPTVSMADQEHDQEADLMCQDLECMNLNCSNRDRSDDHER